MTRFRRASLLAAMLVSIALTVVACGGAAATPTPTPVPVGDVTPPPADVTPTPETPGAEATPADAIPTFDLDALSGAIPGVDSYRTSFSTNGELQYESVVVTQPVLSKAITSYSGGEVSTRFVVIGKEVWQADGTDGAFASVPEAMATSYLMFFDPALLLGAYANMDWASAATNIGTEEKNGVQAHHIRIDPTSFVGAAAAMPPGSAIDIWVADAGYLVAWEMSGFAEGGDMSIQVTNVNDPSNKVDRPS